MGDAVIAAIISSAVTLVGVIISNTTTAEKTKQDIKTSQAVTDTKLEELTREVRIHNNFAQRVPVLEEKMAVANHRIADLEQEHKKE